MINGIIELQEFGICHQDIKLDNTIRYTSEIYPTDFVLKIIDFDWALLLDSYIKQQVNFSFISPTETILRKLWRVR